MCSASYNSRSTAIAVAGLVFVLCAISCDAGSGLDHCSLHNFHHSLNTTHLQYTKEPVNREYAILNQFKSLHCCAKGYRSIEW